MANVRESVEGSFLLQIGRVRVELRERIARAHQLLETRESTLMSELQQLEDEYNGNGVTVQIKELARLRKESISTVQTNANQEFLDQAVARLDDRMRELDTNLEIARNRMRRVVLVWDVGIEIRLSELGAILHDYEKIGVPLCTTGKHNKHVSLTPDHFYRPYGIAIDPETNNIFICDSRNNRVQVYDERLQNISEFGYRMNGPFGICINQHKVYVTQLGNNSLNEYSTEGKFLQSIGCQGNGELEFSFPMGVAVSVEYDRIYVCEWSNNRIQCLDLCLNFDFNFYISRPQDIKLTSQEIIILNGEYANIKFYHYSHQLIREISILVNGRHVSNSGFFCLDRENNIIMTDVSAHCVLAFSSTGQLIHKFGKRGEGLGEFNCPRGISVDYKDRIVVVSENSNYCIQLF